MNKSAAIVTLEFNGYQNLQQDDKLDIFIRSNKASFESEPIVQSIKFTQQKNNKINFVLTSTTSLCSAFLCVDLFRKLPNEYHEGCTTRIGTLNIPIASFVESNFKIKNSIDTNVAALSCDLKILYLHQLQGHNHIEPLRFGKKFDSKQQNWQQDILNKRTQIIEKYHPHDEFTRLISLRWYKTRFDIDILGDAFFLFNHQAQLNENFIHSLFKCALAEISIIEQKFIYMMNTKKLNQQDTNTIARVVGKVLTIYVNAMPYIVDYALVKSAEEHDANHVREHLVPIDSFETTFTKFSGDCEDFTKTMIQIFSYITTSIFEHQSLQLLKDIMLNYIPLATLGGVQKRSIDTLSSTKSAHMWLTLIPLDKFEKMTDASLDQSCTIDNLPMLTLEGTGIVHPIIPNGYTTEEYSKLVDMTYFIEKYNLKMEIRIEHPMNDDQSFYSQVAQYITPHFVNSTCCFSGVTSFIPISNEQSYGISFESYIEHDYKILPLPSLTKEQLDYLHQVVSYNHPIQKSKLGSFDEELVMDTSSTNMRCMNFYSRHDGETLKRMIKELSKDQSIKVYEKTNQNFHQQRIEVYF